MHCVLEELSEMRNFQTAMMQQVAACLHAVQSPQLGNQPLCNSPFEQIKPIAQICANAKMKGVDNDQSSFINPFKIGSQDDPLETFPQIGVSNLSGGEKKVHTESNRQDGVKDQQDPASRAQREMADCIQQVSSQHRDVANEFVEMRMELKRARKVASRKRTGFREICSRFADLLLEDGDKTFSDSEEEEIAQAQEPTKRVRFEEDAPASSQKK